MTSGFSRALKLFQNSARLVPAYKAFLKKHKVNPSRIRNPDDFRQVPTMDRDNYLKSYPYLKLMPEGLSPAMVSMSSGSSGKPFYWPRTLKQEERGTRIHEEIFHKIFGIKKQDSTLVVVCFSMGTWIAGTFTLASSRGLAQEGYNLTVATPGIELKDAVAILRDFAPNYKNIILAGYPPLLMDVIHTALNEKVNLKKLNMYLLMAGEVFSEKWRQTILAMAGIPTDLNRAISIYGTADADVLGHETPLSVFIRRQASKDKKLAAKIFGEAEFLPTFVQYYPQDRYFEEVDNHLVFTTEAAIPLVRYQIRDHGSLREFKDVSSILREFGYDQDARRLNLYSWNLPFITLRRRSDVSVSFYAINIYFENFKVALEDPQVAKFLAGKFVAERKIAANQKDQSLVITAELAPRIKPKAALAAKVARVIFENLLLLNIEYRKLYGSLGKKTWPKVKLLPYGHAKFEVKKSKHKWN